MEKDYDKWNEIKKEINICTKNINYYEGEVWWCSYGLNVGSEQNGGGIYYERPVLIIKKYTKNTFLCLPTTSKNKKGNYFYKLFNESCVILSQPKLMDSKRLKRKIFSLSRKNFIDIKNCFKELI